MAFYKPQTPLQNGENYIYPLTTADQIVLKDGSRLNQKYVSVELGNVTGDETPVIAEVNADNLGGIPAERYAQKTYVLSTTNDMYSNIYNLINTNFARKEETVNKTGDTMSGTLGVPSLAIGGVEIKNLFFPVGSEYITSTYTNPRSWLGGNWKLIDKQLKYGKYDFVEGENIAINVNETSASTVSGWFIINGDTLHFNINVKVNKSLGDTSVELCQLVLGDYGIHLANAESGDQSNIRYLIGTTDGGNGFCNIKADGSVLTSMDVITKESGGTIATEKTISITDTWKIERDQISEIGCDRFIWQRIA